MGWLKKLFSGCLVIGCLGFLLGCEDKPKKKIVAVTQLVSHPAVDAVQRGIKSRLESEYHLGENLEWVFENAHGNIGLAAQIAKKFAGLNPDVIVAITTPSAQAAVSAVRHENIPVVFTAVTDPLGAGLVKNLETPEGNVTGIFDFPPLEEQLDLILQILPDLKTLGIVYNTGETNSVKQVAQMKALAKQRKIKVVEATPLKSTEVLTTVQGILGKVDAIYIPQDNTVVSALTGVVETALTKGIPVFAPDPEGVQSGALASIGYSQFGQGLEAGELVLKILAGEKVNSLAVHAPSKQELHLNTRSAQRLKIEIPRELIEKAQQVVH